MTTIKYTVVLPYAFDTNGKIQFLCGDKSW